MPTFVVAHTDAFNNNLVLEKIEAANWQEAVKAHSNYPWKVHQEGSPFNEPILQTPETFREACWNCDAEMAWMEI